MKIWRIAAVVLLVAGCTEKVLENETFIPHADCIKVSFVDGICGQIVLKIEDTRFAALGETWNGHAPVFYTTVPCQAPADLLQRDFFFVRLLERENTGDCARCEAYFAYTGTKRYFIEVAEACAR